MKGTRLLALAAIASFSLFMVVFIAHGLKSAHADKEPEKPPVPAPEDSGSPQVRSVQAELVEPDELPVQRRLRTVRDLLEPSFEVGAQVPMGWVLLSDIRRGTNTTADGKKTYDVLYIRADAPAFRFQPSGAPVVAIACMKGQWGMDFGINGKKFEFPGPRDYYVSSDGVWRAADPKQEYVISKYGVFTEPVLDLLPGPR